MLSRGSSAKRSSASRPSSGVRRCLPSLRAHRATLTSQEPRPLRSRNRTPVDVVRRGPGVSAQVPGENRVVGSYGHTGWTGTSIWIDPTTQTYIILLTNAVHPRGGNAIALRTKVATAVTAAQPDTRPRRASSKTLRLPMPFLVAHYPAERLVSGANRSAPRSPSRWRRASARTGARRSAAGF